MPCPRVPGQSNFRWRNGRNNHISRPVQNVNATSTERQAKLIIDISNEPVGADLQSDVCIIGGGPAGIAIALKLAGAGASVLVLESGGRAPAEATRDLAKGSTSGVPYFPLEDGRIRALGGSTFRWGARSKPLQPIDFEPRDWIEMSGWPIGPDDLEPYREEVAAMVGLAMPFDFGADVFARMKKPAPGFDPEKVEVAAFQFGKTLLFGERYAPALQAAENIRVLLNATVTDVALAKNGGRIESATVRSPDGKPITATARIFILAAGGIENARLLLNWNRRDRRGLCNDSGLVGRGFMEHPTAVAGIVRTDREKALCDIFSPGLIAGRFIETGLSPAPGVQRERRILNAVARARPVVSADATQALREIFWNFRHRKIPLTLQWYRNEWLRQRLGAIARDPLSIPLNILRHLLGRPKRFRTDAIELEIRIEQAPNLESRVTLSEERDAFGLARAHLHWALTEIDKRTMREAAQLFDEEIRRLGLGEVDFADWIRSDELVFPNDMVGAHHHMGTTRMSAAPSTGVVDADCKAHALDNLYIAGASVFPTAGFANPTFTVLSLACRLADHVARRLASESGVARASNPFRRQPSQREQEVA